MPPGRRWPGCSRRARPPHSPPIRPGSCGTRSRRGCAGSRRSGPRRGASGSRPSSAASTLPAGANLGVLVSSANRDEEVWGPTADCLRPVPAEAQPRRLRLRAALLLRPPLLARADADRGAAAVRAAPEPPGRSRAAAGLQRLGVPRPAAPPRPVGRLMPVGGGRPRPCRPRRRRAPRSDCRGALARRRPGRRRYVAFETWCTHEECPLSDGWLEGEAIRCACHGALFSLADGAPLEGPALDPITVVRASVTAGRTRGRGHPYPAPVSLRLDVPREQALDRAAEIVAEAGAASTRRARRSRRSTTALRTLLAAALPETPTAVLEVLEDARRALDESIAQTAAALLRLRRLVRARDRRARRSARLVLRREPGGVGGGGHRDRGSGDPLGRRVRRLPGQARARSRAVARCRT